ncbi:hypothetical protein LCGC14_1838370 [marine sediment metagenome]|uniref:Uncharacterized protein n=1 Tax=marine sediment metagenome TaxID=412755 RepID=A0A0F9JDB5_9ZZZZ
MNQDKIITTISITFIVIMFIMFGPALAEQSYQNEVDVYNHDLEKHRNKYKMRFDTCLSMDTELQKRDCFEFYNFEPHFENDEMAYNEHVDDKFTNTRPDRLSHWMMLGLLGLILGVIVFAVLVLVLTIIVERIIKINLPRKNYDKRLKMLELGVSRESEMMTRIRDLEQAVYRRNKQ